MKRYDWLPMLLVLPFLLVAEPGSAQLILTGVIDGPLSGGLPKAVEVYAFEDIDDLSRFGLGSATNGGGSDGQEFTFPADTVAKGEFLYVSYDSAGFCDFFGFEADYWGTSAVNVNGDDAIELFRDGMVIDTFGDIDTDGTGQPWEYMDGWAYRQSGTGPDGSTFILDNWMFSGPNALDGETTNASAQTPFPNGTYEPSVAVHLVSFEASVKNGKIVVSWRTASESNCAGFYVLSSTAFEGTYRRENLVPIMAQGGAGITRDYAFEITPVLPEHQYFRLEEITLDGNSIYYPPVKVRVLSSLVAEHDPRTFDLVQNYPNPFNSSTVIRFSLQTDSDVQLSVLDMNGRTVRKLLNAFMPKGEHQQRWEGRGDDGHELPAGLYFCRMQTRELTRMHKMTLLR